VLISFRSIVEEFELMTDQKAQEKKDSEVAG
jgi:hypothetical protein